MSFTAQILSGLTLGVLTGVFLGELAAPFTVAGDVFIGLLQMTVLPYIVLSLVANLGRISWSESRGLLLAGLAVLGVLLLLGGGVLLLTPLAFPPWETASFFSNSLLQSAAPLDLVALYVPANPFAALAGNVVPAAVLFSILLGVAISGVPGNAGLLSGLDVLIDALNRINKMVIRLTPYGVLTIAAGTAGTISIEEMTRLQGYLIAYTALVIVLTVLVLPLLVTAVTPFRYRDLIGIPKDSLITIFAAAKIIVLMPQLIENVKELFRRYDLEDDEVDSGAQILLPLAYPFPNLGTYVILMFVGFAAWYMGRSLDVGDQLTLQLISLPSSFVAPIIGIPFLLDAMRIPADVMELFVISTVYTDRIRVVLGAMHLLTLTIVVLAIRRGVFVVKPRRLMIIAGIALLGIVGALLGVRAYLAYAVSGTYQGDAALVQMGWMDRTVDATVYLDDLPPVSGAASGDRLARIRERGTLRVGFVPESLPFAFVNESSEATGFDMELAHDLAGDLGVGLEVVRIDLDRVDAALELGHVDIVMSGLAVTPERSRRWRFSASPLDLTMALLVADHRRKEFASFTALDDAALALGVVQSDPAFMRQLQLGLPTSELVQVRSPRGFLRGNRPDLDAVVYSAEGGSAWTLIYPEYTVVVPESSRTLVPAAYPLPRDDESWARYVNLWITLKKKDGTVARLFDHWIRGGGAASDEPRWSVVRNVLGWVD